MHTLVAYQPFQLYIYIYIYIEKEPFKLFIRSTQQENTMDPNIMRDPTMRNS